MLSSEDSKVYMNIVDYALVTGAIYLSLYVSYLLVLIGARFLIEDEPALRRLPTTRFGVVVPAHDEQLFIGRMLGSVEDQDYPKELVSAIVVADNCSDKTAHVALGQGALVLERTDSENRGKGYAVRYALEKLNRHDYDAILVVDADSILEVGCLRSLDCALAKGERVIQCYNGVLNPDDSWFTRLLDVSRTIGNEILHPGKIKLGVSSYLMGNGMCFSRDIVWKESWNAFTVGEDWEYYAMLIEKGYRVGFVKDARVFHQESVSLKQATSQRMRWSSGRFAVVGNYGLRLLGQGLMKGDWKRGAASFPLIVPNPSMGLNITLVSLIGAWGFASAHPRTVILWWLGVLCALQGAIFILGICYTKNRMKNLIAVAFAPLFLIWKLGIDLLSVLGFGRSKWIRTERRR